MRTPHPTTDEDAFLAAIADAPLDDAPRLVYADWLQDRGQEAKAEYVRTVVRLLHSPEDAAAVERCLALADGLDPQWRQAVGGRFEVVMTGVGGIHVATLVLRLVLGLFTGDLIGAWQKGHPIRLKSSLTREDADAFLRRFRDPLLRGVRVQDPSAEVSVRPMDRESPLTLFAPDEST